MKILKEQNYTKTKKTNKIEKAILNRHPITFYYSGGDAKKGIRVRGEAVALGLSKANNLLVRIYISPPSVTKTGYDKTHWRTFDVKKMKNIIVNEDETFDFKREQYKDGKESSKGPMLITYLTTNWNKKGDIEEPEIEPEEEPEIEPEVEPEIEPEEEPEIEPEEEPEEEPQPTPEPEEEPEEPEIENDYDVDNLPQPNVKEKPSPTPDTYQKNDDEDVFKELEKSLITVGDQKYLLNQDYYKYVKDLYNRKLKNWKDAQRTLGINTMPGEGTRRKFEISSNNELSKLISKNKIKVTNVIPQELQENINRIKSLMIKII